MQALWNRHYHAGVTGSYHGDMAQAFQRMLADPECSDRDRAKMRTSIFIHCNMERDPRHQGRKYFCELFGRTNEKPA